MFNLWIEGYIAQGMSARAEFLGSFDAVDFASACDKWAETVEQKYLYKRCGNVATYWGCRIYDNEIDARKSFG